MGQSKNLLMQMREADIVSLYDATFTKKEAQATGTNLANEIADNGNVSKHEALANLLRLNEVISTAIDVLKSKVSDEKTIVLGVEFTPNNGRSMMQYKDDAVWCELNEKLKERENLLKLATNSKDEIYDSEGVQVSRVSVHYSKSSLTIKF
jgi:hypothetical protein